MKGRHENQIGNILIFQDLTEIKQMEKKLEKSKNMALIGEMAAGLAHEMRNPLAAITGSIELLEQGLKLEGTDERLMEIILRGKDQLENFVRDFLSLARPVPVSRELVDLNEVVEEVLENIKLNKDWTNKIKIIKVLSTMQKLLPIKNRLDKLSIILCSMQSSLWKKAVFYLLKLKWKIEMIRKNMLKLKFRIPDAVLKKMI